MDKLTWEWSHVVLTDKHGNDIFNRTCRFPTSWSTNAKIITASKYFTDAENDLEAMVDRVVDTITDAGIKQGVLGINEEAQKFSKELKSILINQEASFNSPVWFNIGVPNRPQQASACFLLDVQDDMNSILDWIKTEGVIFKGGSGSGINISKLRGEGEPINPRGTSSGPLSFMAAADSLSGSIKSGGATRRAAKMVIMDCDHPDIMEFINCKKTAEDMLRRFRDLGEDIDVNSKLLNFIPYQNANNSVSLTDDFMKAVLEDKEWELKPRVENGKSKTIKARDLWKKIAEVAWECADPGVFFYDTINKWHTVPNSGPIITCNPCGEFLHLPFTACNLASINLMKFYMAPGGFDTNKFTQVVKTMITAMEILVSYSDYPIPAIDEMSEKYRPLGLGYANLGALLMCFGYPYDSDEARGIAASITSLMTATAYFTSGQLAKRIGPSFGYQQNEVPFKNVINMHANANNKLTNTKTPTSYTEIAQLADGMWKRCIKESTNGYRNCQVTLLAPTGTISFMMDCDTTGIEPDLALVKHKTLVGGGYMEIVNQNVETALINLAYDATQIYGIMSYIKDHNTVEGCNTLHSSHMAIFDCAFVGGGTRSIAPKGHVDMVAAIQPFLSGGISKTVNIPADYTPDDIMTVYMDAYLKGVKDISIYRDGSKVAQPLKSKTSKKEAAPIEISFSPEPIRKRLPDTRNSKTHKFNIAGHEGYLTVGLYQNGEVGEIFVTMSKEGSTIAGLMDAFATSVSIGLQYGVPLKSLIEKFKHYRFEPSGFTGNQDVPSASSVVDYIFTWLEQQFSTIDTIATPEVKTPSNTIPLQIVDNSGDCCGRCGGILVQAGACKTCKNCGDSSGCG